MGCLAPWIACTPLGKLFKGMAGNIQKREETCGPTVVLEALSDYHLWFWHASFGYAGLLNDLNILNLSSLLELLVNGTFAELEQSSMLVPFEVAGNLFNRLFVLVDGIYPPILAICQRHLITTDRCREALHCLAGGIKERHRTRLWEPSKSLSGDDKAFSWTFVEENLQHCLSVSDHAQYVRV
jgi:hypothetical protein